MRDRRTRERRAAVAEYLKGEKRRRERRAQIRNAKISDWMRRFDAARNR